jgi:hypothetical protein
MTANAYHLTRMETKDLLRYRSELEARGKEAVKLGKREDIIVGLRKAWKAVDVELKNRANSYQANAGRIQAKASRYGKR